MASGNRTSFKKGHVISLEVRRKMSVARTGMKHTEEWNRNIGLANKNPSLEKRERMSRAQKGKVFSKEHRAKLSAWQKGRKLSVEHRLKISGGIKGSRNPNWNGGVTSLNEQIRKSPEYKLWREAVFIRDNWTCIWCGAHGVVLHADHIKRFSDFPALRFAIDNGRTLCKPCHKKTDTYGTKGWKKKKI